MTAVHSPGEPPKSLSSTSWLAGTVQMSSWASDGLSLMTEKPRLSGSPLPVVT